MLRLFLTLAFTYALLGFPPPAATAAPQSPVGSISQQILSPYPQLVRHRTKFAEAVILRLQAEESRHVPAFARFFASTLFRLRMTFPQTRRDKVLVAASVSELAMGKVLVASRRLRDPNFAETVILLLEYSENGAMGVVINRPTTVSLSSVLPKVQALKERKDLVYLGGPVGREQILLLARSGKEPEDSKQILSNVYLVASQISLQQLVGRDDTNLRLRAYAGYAGWAPEQLDTEIARGDWHIQSTDAATVFDTPAEQLWPELIHRSEVEWARNDQTHEIAARTLY